MKKHEENKDLRLVSKVCKVSVGDHTIRANRNATIGIRTWGRIDFLTRHRGWIFLWDNSAGITNQRMAEAYWGDVKSSKRDAKAPKLTDKRK